ncbi:MAG: protein tyrosine phosphatase family protein [Enterobacterales bacterium]|nr:protein tyrosine phosphatase family protein [Enterobacterales bacterium]
MLNTIKTTLGYVVTLVSKYTPLNFEQDSLEGIYNYLPINDRLTTSGQPTASQFKHIKEQGFELVINLAPHDAENAIKDEAGTVERLGMKYIHLPVNFQKPSERKFATFVNIMEDSQDKKIWLHCAANMRVSAFLYRYRTEHRNMPDKEAKTDLYKIWQPVAVWSEFIKAGPAKTMD